MSTRQASLVSCSFTHQLSVFALQKQGLRRPQLTGNKRTVNKKHLKNVGPIRYCEPFCTVIHQGSLLPPLSHAACASMSTTTTTTTTMTTTTRDRGDRYGPMEWAQLRQISTMQVTSYVSNDADRPIVAGSRCVNP